MQVIESNPLLLIPDLDKGCPVRIYVRLIFSMTIGDESEAKWWLQYRPWTRERIHCLVRSSYVRSKERTMRVAEYEIFD